MSISVIAAAAASILAAQAEADQAPEPAQNAEPEFAPLTLGETITLTILDEPREINVILPPGYYEEPQGTWPVVYMLDGGLSQDLLMGAGIANWNRLWGRSHAVILVGVETKDRQRELLPETRDPAEAARYPTAGDALAFREWLITKVTSTIEGRYRVNGTDYLVGESAAGHFVLETWLDAAPAFDGYAAISPSLQWDFETLSVRVERAGDQAEDQAENQTRPPLYLSLADEGGATESGIMRVVDAMEPAQKWCFSDRREDLVHATSLHGLLPEALQFLSPTEADWLEEFGFTLRCEQSGR